MTTTAPTVLPKAGSGALRAVWSDVRQILDMPRAVIVIEGALDRGALEEILRKLVKGAAARPGTIPKPEIVGRLAEAFHESLDVAFLVMRALDKSCHKERHIVASIDEASLSERLAS